MLRSMFGATTLQGASWSSYEKRPSDARRYRSVVARRLGRPGVELLRTLGRRGKLSPSVNFSTSIRQSESSTEVMMISKRVEQSGGVRPDHTRDKTACAARRAPQATGVETMPDQSSDKASFLATKNGRSEERRPSMLRLSTSTWPRATRR